MYNLWSYWVAAQPYGLVAKQSRFAAVGSLWGL
jgi:hypothetical protein